MQGHFKIDSVRKVRKVRAKWPSFMPKNLHNANVTLVGIDNMIGWRRVVVSASALKPDLEKEKERRRLIIIY